MGRGEGEGGMARSGVKWRRGCGEGTVDGEVGRW